MFDIVIAGPHCVFVPAGNFVDLSKRQFYTGLAVKSSRKRLGAVPTSSDNVIVNDLRQLSDTAAELRGDVQGLFGTERPEDVDDEIPILGSFQEGFYDPLTAQPRRIPLEIVACGSGPAGTLTYSSSYASLDDDTADARTTTYNALLSSTSPQRSFSSSTSAVSSDSAAANATYSNFSPALSFNIPGLVALNHPDAVSNGGSSEFFSLPQQNMSKKRAKLLDGQYAPFGYIVSGEYLCKLGDAIVAILIRRILSHPSAVHRFRFGCVPIIEAGGCDRSHTCFGRGSTESRKDPKERFRRRRRCQS